MLAHVPSFGRNPRGSPDFLAYPVPKACMHVLGTRVLRRLGVARSASSPKAALALGCSLTPGLRISFGRVTCMARAASVPGLWALGFLLLACVCGWVRVAVGPGFGLPLPVVAGVLGGCVWARFVVLSLFCRLFVVFVVRLWCRPAFGTCVVSCAFPLPPAVSGSGVRWRACWARVSAVPRPSWLGCLGVFFSLFFLFSGCWVSLSRALWSLPVSFLSGWAAGFFFLCLLVSVPLFPVGRCSWLGVAGFGWVVPLCLSGGPVFGALWVGGLATFCVVGGRFGGCGLFSRGPALPPPLFFLGGGGGRPGCSSLCLPTAGACSVAGVWCRWSLATPGGGSCVLLPATPGWVSLPVVVGGPRHSWLGSAGGAGVLWVVCGGGVLVGLWLVCGVVGPSPLLAEVPVCYSPPLLAGFRCRWWWAVPATPCWGPLAAVVCGVWCVAVVCWWGPSPLLAEVPVCYSPPLLAGFRCRWWWAVPATPGWGPLAAVVCGVWCVVCGVLVGSLATPGGGSCVLLPTTPGGVSLPLVAGSPRHSWLGSACGGGVWCVVCGGGVLVGSLATPGGRSCVLLPATPGWVSLPLVVGGPRHSWLGSAGGAGVLWVVCGGGVLVGLWLVCGVVGSSPLLAEVPVCYSPPLLAGFRCRWWWAVPATPCWGPLAAVVCGVWCVAVVCWWGPRHSWRRFLCATPRHSWLGFAAAGGGQSPPLLAGVRWRRWCVGCGVWCVVCWWGPSPLLAEVPVCYSPPLLAGFRCRWWPAVPATPGWGPLAAVVCGVWCVAVVCWWGPSPLLADVPVCYSPPLLAGFRCRWWLAVPATPGWGPLAALVCGVWRWCVGGVVAGVWCGWSLATPGGGFMCATPRHSWLGFAAADGGRSPPLLAGVRWRRLCVGCGVWCAVCWWGCGWCVVWLVPRHSWRRFLCATPRHSWLGFAAADGGRSPPLLAGVRWRRCCVVCGVWRWCVGGVVAGVWCGWSLATPGGGSCVLLPATPGRVSLPVVVGGPRHSWLGSACGGGVWCVVCGVWCVVCGGGVLVGLWLVCGVVGPSPLLAEVPVCYSPPLLAGFRCRWWWAVPATPGWGTLAAVVCGVRCVVCGGGVLFGLWLVCGVVGPSPFLAEVPVCYSPPLLAGFRCRWWWAVPATPG